VLALTASDPEEAAVLLRETALQNNSKDNVSVLVIFFPGYVPPPKKEDENLPKKTVLAERKPRRTKSSGLSVSTDAINEKVPMKKNYILPHTRFLTKNGKNWWKKTSYQIPRANTNKNIETNHRSWENQMKKEIISK